MRAALPCHGHRPVETEPPCTDFRSFAEGRRVLREGNRHGPTGGANRGGPSERRQAGGDDRGVELARSAASGRMTRRETWSQIGAAGAPAAKDTRVGPLAPPKALASPPPPSPTKQFGVQVKVIVAGGVMATPAQTGESALGGVPPAGGISGVSSREPPESAGIRHRIAGETGTNRESPSSAGYADAGIGRLRRGGSERAAPQPSSPSVELDPVLCIPIRMGSTSLGRAKHGNRPRVTGNPDHQVRDGGYDSDQDRLVEFTKERAEDLARTLNRRRQPWKKGSEEGAAPL